MKRIMVGGIVVAIGVCVAVAFWPRGEDEISGQEKKKKSATEFASDRGASAMPTPAPFDGDRAMKHLKDICDIGPRMSGTPGMKAQQELIQKHFEALGYKVEYQRFIAVQKSRPTPVDMANMIISIHPDKKRRVILCCHYDTRPIADQEKDLAKWHQPFVSANDGASGVAFLMELGRHMKDLTTQVGVDFVIFDGEEYIFERKKDDYFFGSKHFAQTWKTSKKETGIDYAAALLLDMIAGEFGRFKIEGHSWRRARPLVIDVWDLARRLGSRHFLLTPPDFDERDVQDDHIALLNVGIPAVDIIDFDYPHWHKLSDTPARCSALTMNEVARVLSVWLQTVK